MTYSCARQNPDGAWYYGEEPMYHWIDNFHTGYNLDCLKRYMDKTGDTSFETNFRAGYKYYTGHFFEANGRPKYYHDKGRPVDIQCAAQSIDTLAFCSDIYPASLDLASKVALWTIGNMQAKDGHFYYRDLGWKKIKTPMFHWGQGTMFKALAHLVSKLPVARSQRDLALRRAEGPIRGWLQLPPRKGTLRLSAAIHHRQDFLAEGSARAIGTDLAMRCSDRRRGLG